MERQLTEAESRELISQLLQEILDEDGVTGKDIAVIAGVHQSTVSNWLNRKITASLDKVVLIARRFGKEDSPILAALGVHASHPYQFRTLGPFVEELDKILNTIQDPRIRALAEDRIKADVRALRDTIESLTELINSTNEE